MAPWVPGVRAPFFGIVVVSGAADGRSRAVMHYSVNVAGLTTQRVAAAGEGRDIQVFVLDTLLALSVS